MSEATAHVDQLVDRSAALATAMALDLSAASRAELIRLRGNGWRAGIEISFDNDGFALVRLTAIAPKGQRREFGQLMHELRAGAH